MAPEWRHCVTAREEHPHYPVSCGAVLAWDRCCPSLPDYAPPLPTGKSAVRPAPLSLRLFAGRMGSGLRQTPTPRADQRPALPARAWLVPSASRRPGGAGGLACTTNAPSSTKSVGERDTPPGGMPRPCRLGNRRYAPPLPVGKPVVRPAPHRQKVLLGILSISERAQKYIDQMPDAPALTGKL